MSSRILATKLRRDLRRQTTAFVAVGITVLLGVALFGAAFDALLNLQGSYAQVFDRLAVADVWITGGDTDAIADEVAALDEVASVATRTQVDLPLRVGDDKLAGRLVGLPDDPRLNDVSIESGRRPAGGGGVLAEQHLAGAFGLQSGDEVELLVAGDWQALPVRGSAASGEYLWLAASRQEVVSLPSEFGVVFAPQSTVESLTGHSPNQALVRLGDGVAREDVAPAIERLARQRGATDVFTWDDQPSNAALQEDITGFSQMALLFPLLFLTAAAMASYTLLSRRIHQERSIIGMLRAQGATPRDVTRHYLGYGLVAGVGGAVPGVLLGMWLARALTNLYVGFLELPFTAVALHPATPVIGIAFGVVTGVLAAWGPARAAARIGPAEAMRGVVPETGGGRSLLERLVPFSSRMPATWRLVLRSITRNRRRTAMTVGGVMLALLLVLVSWSILDTVQGNLDRQFTEHDHSDLRAQFSAGGDGEVLASVRDVEGVAVAEPTTQLPVTVTGPGGAYATVLEALPADTSLRSFAVVEGDPQGLAAHGLLVGVAMRDLIGAEVGDTVQVEVQSPRGDAEPVEVEVPIAGFVQEPLGTFAYTSRDDLADTLGGPVPATGALVALGEDVDASMVRGHVEALDGVAATQSSSALRDLMEDVTGLLVGFVSIMLACGAVLAATMIFTTVSVSIAERTREVATLRASGVSTRRLARLITAEHMVVTLMGVVPGVVLGLVGGRAMMATYTTDQFALDFMVAPTTVLVSIGALLLVALAAQVPGLRSLGRLDLARTVRERGA